MSDLSAFNSLLARLRACHPQEIDLSLVRITEILNKIGNPHTTLPPTFHIAGTNGKGSTLAFLKNLLQKQGYSVSRYISPHLIHWTERIELSSGPITYPYFCELLTYVLRCNEGGALTLFEGLTAAAFRAFCDNSSDFLLLETGLGGKLDATNVIQKPLASIITTISYDHMDFLGDTIMAIATQKAGIIKAGCPTILGMIEDEAVKAYLIAYAMAHNSPVFCVSDYLNSTKTHITLPSYAPIALNNLGLMGPHQRYNAATALLALWVSGCFHSSETIPIALSTTYWPGRLETIKHSKLNSRHQWTVDGAHNSEGARALSRSILNWSNPIILVIAMKQGKLPHDFLDTLLSPIYTQITHIFIYTPDLSRKEDTLFIPADTVHKIIKGLDYPFTVEFGTMAEIFQFLDSVLIPSHVLVCGSLYLVGIFLAELD